MFIIHMQNKQRMHTSELKHSAHSVSFTIVLPVTQTMTCESVFTLECCCCPHSSETQGSGYLGSQHGAVAWEKENKLNQVKKHPTRLSLKNVSLVIPVVGFILSDKKSECMYIFMCYWFFFFLGVSWSELWKLYYKSSLVRKNMEKPCWQAFFTRVHDMPALKQNKRRTVLGCLRPLFLHCRSNDKSSIMM